MTNTPSSEQGFTLDLTDAQKRALPCFRNPHDWQDSTLQEDQERAQRRCVLECGQRAWCEEQRQQAVRDFGQAVGVWAGNIWVHRDYIAKGA